MNVRPILGCLLLLIGQAVLAGCGAGGLSVATPSPTATTSPEAAIAAYFAALGRGDAGRAFALMGPDLRAQYAGSQSQGALTHAEPIRFVSAQETKASLAQPAARRAQRREYTVELDVSLGSGWHGNWNEGRNSRFVGVVREDNDWRVDAIATSPGFLGLAR